MKIVILSVGSIKEAYLKEAIKEYVKRISKYSKVSFIQVADEPIADNSSAKEIEAVKMKEGKKLLKAMPEHSYKIALDLKGTMLSSPELAQKIQDICSYQDSTITFIIGGSLGLSSELLSSVNYHLCFSKMTFPHQLMQVILLEQIYRSFKIIHHETYHK